MKLLYILVQTAFLILLAASARAGIIAANLRPARHKTHDIILLSPRIAHEFIRCMPLEQPHAQRIIERNQKRRDGICQLLILQNA